MRWVAFFCLPSKRGGVSRLRRGKHRDCEGTHGPSNLDCQEQQRGSARGPGELPPTDDVDVNVVD